MKKPVSFITVFLLLTSLFVPIILWSSSPNASRADTAADALVILRRAMGIKKA